MPDYSTAAGLFSLLLQGDQVGAAALIDTTTEPGQLLADVCGVALLAIQTVALELGARPLDTDQLTQLFQGIALGAQQLPS